MSTSCGRHDLDNKAWQLWTSPVIGRLSTYWFLHLCLHWDHYVDAAFRRSIKTNINKAKKNKSYVSKLPRAFVFRCAFDSAKSKVWNFFACVIFFFQFFMNFLVKIYKKRYDKHNETLWTTDFFNSVFCLVSCSSKNQVPYFKAVTDSNLTRLLLREKKKKKTFKKKRVRSGLPICHELWDIAFIFLA